MAAEPAPTDRPWPTACWLTAGVAVFATAWLAYWPILPTYFHHDDFSWLAVARHWQEAPASIVYGDTGITLVWNLLFNMAYRMGGWWNATPYFAGLIAVHAVCSLLVMWFVRQVGGRPAAAVAAGAFFAVLFTHHEAVGWVAAGLHPLMTLGLLLTVNLWLLADRGAVWPRLAAPLGAVLTVLAKDSGVVIGPLLLVTAQWGGRQPLRRTWRRLLLCVGPAYVVLLGWRLLLPPRREAIAPGGPDYYLGWHSLLNLVGCVPQSLLPDLQYANYRALLASRLGEQGAELGVLASRLGIAALVCLSAWALWRGHRLVRLAVAWCYVAYLPFVPFSYGYARAPRYLYASSVGLALLVGLAYSCLWRRFAGRPARRAALGAAFVLLLLANLAPIRLMAQRRLADSESRRQVLARIVREVPKPAPQDEVYLLGLPEYLQDLALAVPLLYSVPVTGHLGPPPSPRPGVYVLDLSGLQKRPAEHVSGGGP